MSNEADVSKPEEANSVDGGLTCPDAEVLAAYLDGTLERAGREGVEAHLAGCAECRSVVAETVRFQLEASPPSTDVVPLTRRRPMPRLVMTLGALAAAAVLLLITWVALRPPSTDMDARRPELAELVAAVGDSRPFEPRLTGGFRYGPLQPVLRSGPGSDLSVRLDLRIAVAKLEQAHVDLSTPERTAAFASAQLVLGRVESALALLEEVTRRRSDSAPVWSDLAAAYLVAASRTDDPDAAGKALVAADRALALNGRLPEALFNRALALEALGRAHEARAVWKTYASLPARDAWTEEATRRAAEPRP